MCKKIWIQLGSTGYYGIKSVFCGLAFGNMPKILNMTFCRFTTLHQTPTFTSQTLNNGVNGTREVGFISSNSFQKLYWNASNGQANLTSNPCYNEEADLARGLLQKRVISILCVSALNFRQANSHYILLSVCEASGSPNQISTFSIYTCK